MTTLADIDFLPYDFILGSDECGYGAWASCLTVCAAIVPKTWAGSSSVTDSKVLTERKRDALATAWGPKVLHTIVDVPPEEVDRLGVYKAVIQAHKDAIRLTLEKHKALGLPGEILVIVDGNLLIPGATSLPKADLLVPAVSIASILGKVHRDKYMVEMGRQFPGYSFELHKGYGTPAHIKALEKLGPCEIHRKSYSPIKAFLQKAKEPEENMNSWEIFDE